MIVGGSFGGTNDLPTFRHQYPSAMSLLDAVERRTQRTYRYGIILVCIGATFNWLGFAQGSSFSMDPLRYLGVGCVVSGSFCVCFAMCRWIGKPTDTHISELEEDDYYNSREADEAGVQVFNVAVPMFIDPRPVCKPPEYEIVAGEPPTYDEALKLNAGALIPLEGSTPLYVPPSESSPSHSNSTLIISNEQRKSMEDEEAPPPYDSNTNRHHPLNSSSLREECMGLLNGESTFTTEQLQNLQNSEQNQNHQVITIPCD